MDDITEPSAVAPDAKVYFGNKPKQYELTPELTLASGATALGSVSTVSLLESSNYSVRAALTDQTEQCQPFYGSRVRSAILLRPRANLLTLLNLQTAERAEQKRLVKPGNPLWCLSITNCEIKERHCPQLETEKLEARPWRL